VKKPSPKILILGVTASGKSALAFELSKAIGAEIISVDSMKVYRRMDIGTAKPPSEKRSQIPYHLIDVVEPSEAFSVDKFLDLTEKAVADIQGRGKPVVAVGGTAMYIKALLLTRRPLSEFIPMTKNASSGHWKCTKSPANRSRISRSSGKRNTPPAIGW
jgi:tRNA dimethylallyltransferase